VADSVPTRAPRAPSHRQRGRDARTRRSPRGRRDHRILRDAQPELLGMALRGGARDARPGRSSRGPPARPGGDRACPPLGSPASARRCAAGRRARRGRRRGSRAPPRVGRRARHVPGAPRAGQVVHGAGRRSPSRQPAAEARAFLQEGLELARRCGAIVLTERAHAELLATGARPRRVVRSGIDSLTPSERRVAQMATEGQTNREIAQSLFVTPKTVETHLSRLPQARNPGALAASRSNVRVVELRRVGSQGDQRLAARSDRRDSASNGQPDRLGQRATNWLRRSATRCDRREPLTLPTPAPSQSAGQAAPGELR
jgi:DNA-binding CsgD family transcriptional regulator